MYAVGVILVLLQSEIVHSGVLFVLRRLPMVSFMHVDCQCLSLFLNIISNYSITKMMYVVVIIMCYCDGVFNRVLFM